MKKVQAIIYACAAVAAMAAFFVLMYATWFNGCTTKRVNKAAAPENAGTITRLNGGAFGRLSSIAADKTAASDSAKQTSALSAGGGSGMPSASPMMAESFANDISSRAVEPDMAIMPPYYPTAYKFVYRGEDLPGLSDEMPVYKKSAKNYYGSAAGQLGINLGLGVIGTDKFKDAKVSSLNLVEDKDYGYSIFINFADGSVSLYGDWAKWPRPDSRCMDEKCFEMYRLKIEDVPADSAIVSVADQFLRDYGVDMKNYGSGEVMDYWRRDYIMSPDRTNYYIPETISVVYPALIEGKTLYDQSGGKSGLAVEVNIGENKVFGCRIAPFSGLESSNYKIITDKKKIISLAEEGGMSGMYRYYDYYNPDDQGKEVEVALGTPVLGLLVHWRYDADNGTSEELYVPAYIFPVINKENSAYYGQENIVVPLVAELFEGEQGGPIMIMKDGAVPASDTPSIVTASEIGIDEIIGTAESAEQE